MKKLLAFLICVTLVLSLFGCKKVEENVRGTISYSDDEEIEGKKVTEKEYNKKTDKEEKKSKKLSLGKTSGTTYTNEFIGIGCKLDKGWTFKSEEEIMEINNFTLDMFDEETREILENASIIYDMFATDANGIDNINVNLEKVDNSLLTSTSLVDVYESQISAIDAAYQNMGGSIEDYDIKKVKIDGKKVDALSIVVNLQGVDIYQLVFSIKCDGYLANISLTTIEEKGISELLSKFYWL